MLYNAQVTLELALTVEADGPDTAEVAARARAAAAAPSCSVAAVVSHPLTVLEQLQADNVVMAQEIAVIDKAGTANQRARWFRGLLPDEELLELAREELFAPFAHLARRAKMRHTDIRHTPMCGRSVPPDVVTWSTHTEPTLNAAEWRTLEDVERAARAVLAHPWMARSPSDACTVQAREHRGGCTRCGRSLSQRAALVTIVWAGRREITREYLL